MILAFWGYWNGPQLDAAQTLIALDERFRDKPVAIIAVHDSSIASRDDYERRLAATRTRFWGGRELPFTVALDAPGPEGRAEGSGVSTNLYSRGATRAFSSTPAFVVIDPQGKIAAVAPYADRDKLASIIQGLLDDPPKP